MSRTAAFLAGSALVLGCAACASGYEAGSDQKGGDRRAEAGQGDGRSGDNSEAGQGAGKGGPRSRTGPELDVCKEVTSESARIMMGLTAGTKVETSDVSDRAEGIPPNLGCRYSWQEGDQTVRMRISVIPDNDLKDDPAKLLETIIGSAGKPYKGIDAVAGFDKGGYAGEGVMVFGATARTGLGLTSVSVYAPDNADERVLAEAAEMLLGRLEDGA